MDWRVGVRLTGVSLRGVPGVPARDGLVAGVPPVSVTHPARPRQVLRGYRFGRVLVWRVRLCLALSLPAAWRGLAWATAVPTGAAMAGKASTETARRPEISRLGERHTPPVSDGAAVYLSLSEVSGQVRAGPGSARRPLSRSVRVGLERLGLLSGGGIRPLGIGHRARLLARVDDQRNGADEIVVLQVHHAHACR